MPLARGKTTTRAEMVTWIAGGFVPEDGVYYILDGLFYVGETGSTAIADLPGLVYATNFETELQGLADDVNAAIAALSNGSVFTTLGVNDTATSSMRLAVESDSVRFTADTADFELFMRRASSTDDVRIAMGEGSTKRFTFGIEGGDDYFVTASTDGVSISTAYTIYGASGYVGIAKRLGIGVGASPSYGFHLKGGASGATAPTASDGRFVIEDDANLVNYLLVPDANTVNWYYGGATDNDFAREQVFYNSNNPYFRWAIAVSGTAADIFEVKQYGPRIIKTYTVATKPSAAIGAGQIIYLSDGAGNKKLAVSDNSAWYYMDGTAV
jgi:hypothetical protein